MAPAFHRDSPRRAELFTFAHGSFSFIGPWLGRTDAGFGSHRPAEGRTQRQEMCAESRGWDGCVSTASFISDQES